MNGSITRWTAAVAVAVLFALPAGSRAQTPSSAQQPTASATQPAQQTDNPQDHLRQAEQALNGISPTAVTGRAKSKINELKQHINALQRATASNDKASTTGAESRNPRATSGARGTAKWANEVAAIDRILTELIGPSSAGVGQPSATGTTGATKPSESKAAATVNIDDETRSKLMEVRKHITAFSAAMSGSASSPSPAPATDMPAQPPTSATQPAASTTPPATSEPPNAAQPQQSTPPASTPPTSTPPASATPTEPAAAPQTAAAQPNVEQPNVDKTAAKRHLTAARNTLSELTKLPAAAQLQGDARTQVSQLISNFNELITTDQEWRAVYAKVEANVAALLGAQTTDEAPAAPATGTAGAVGTTGTASASLDPAIRAKLIEFRSQLKDFEKAAAGTSTSSSTMTGAASATATGSMTASPAQATPSQAAPQSSQQTTPPASQTTSPQTSTAAQKPEQMSRDEALTHIEAIEAILKINASASSVAGTAGTTTPGATPTTGSASASGAATSLTLDRAQIEQLKMHLNELKRLLNK